MDQPHDVAALELVDRSRLRKEVLFSQLPKIKGMTEGIASGGKDQAQLNLTAH